jgi:hypothetical protein
MDEMQLIREFGEPVKLPDHDDLASARAKLLAAASRPEKATVHPLRSRKRLVWLGATAVGLAAAITAVVALAPVDKVGLPISVPQAQADPVQVLHAAAAAALKMPATPPRPDQFVYMKEQASGGSAYEGWLSADGTHDGLIKREGKEEVSPGCRNGKRVITGSNGGRHDGKLEDCQPTPAYDPALPGDADAMLAHLAAQYEKEGKLENVNGIAKDVSTLLSMNYLRPDQRAALFEAVAKVPGLILTKNVKDAVGRTGDSISWDTKKGQAGGFVFDPVTHAYLGATHGEAQLAYGIVDKVNQVP